MIESPVFSTVNTVFKAEVLTLKRLGELYCKFRLFKLKYDNPILSAIEVNLMTYIFHNMIFSLRLCQNGGLLWNKFSY